MPSACPCRPTRSCVASPRPGGADGSSSCASAGPARSCWMPPTTPRLYARSCRTSNEVYPAGLPIVFGAMRDKDATAMLQTLAPCATRVVCTAPHTPRAIPAEQIGDRARQIGPTARVVVEPNCWSAVRHAWDARSNRLRHRIDLPHRGNPRCAGAHRRRLFPLNRPVARLPGCDHHGILR